MLSQAKDKKKLKFDAVWLWHGNTNYEEGYFFLKNVKNNENWL